LEAFTAKNRAALRGPKRDGSFLAALRTIRLGLRAHLEAAPICGTTALGTACLASFTTFRFVFEAFVGEKHLFAGGKYKLGAALRALQDPIVIFH
jgi:hypothetical protein